MVVHRTNHIFKFIWAYIFLFKKLSDATPNLFIILELVFELHITTGGFPKFCGWGTAPIDRLHGGGRIWAEADRPRAGNPLVIRAR